VLEDSNTGQELELRILDLPLLHQPYAEPAQEFARVLAGVEDTSIFKYKSIRSILSFRWGLTKEYVLRKQMMPYCGFFLSYLVYAFCILPLDRKFQDAEEAGDEYPVTFFVIDKIWLTWLVLFSIYFLKNEWR